MPFFGHGLCDRRAGGFESLCDGPKKERPPSLEALQISEWWAMRDVRVRLAPPASVSGLRPSRATLENACAFPQLRTLAGSNPSAMGPKRKAPIAGGLIIQVVGDEGCPRAASPPASASGLRPSRAALENACAFPQLRTLAGSNPMHWAQKRKAPVAGSLSKQVVGDEGYPRAASPPAFAAALRALRAALENALRFLSSAPWRVRIPCTGPKKERLPLLGAYQNKWWAMRDSNPQPCACKAPALTVAPIARRD